MQIASSIAGATIILALTGCSGTVQYLRSQPVTFFPGHIADTAVPPELDGLLVLHCMKRQSAEYQEKSGEKGEICVYLSADVSELTSALQQRNSLGVRNAATVFLLTISDMNCSNFLNRAFADKTGVSLTKGLVGDITTGVSAGTAQANPAISAALSGFNLILGKSVDTWSQTYFADKTFQALESVIAAERSRIKTEIIANRKLDVDMYSVAEALSDIRRYDDACSIKAGLSGLVTMADAKKQDNQKALNQVESAANPANELKTIDGQSSGKRPARTSRK